MPSPPIVRTRFHRSETFETTIAGLLTQRANILGEAMQLRDRMAEIKNDVAALDRVLVSLGYQGDLDAQMPRQRREVLFGTGELTRGIVDTLRDATGALTSRQIAVSILELQGSDARDRKLMGEHTKRVSKALRKLVAAGRVTQATDDVGRVVWRVGSGS